MENTQKETDYQILLKFLEDHSFWSSAFSLQTMIKDAFPFVDEIQNCNTPLSVKEFIHKAASLVLFRESGCPDDDIAYTFVLVIYVLLKVEEPKNNYQRIFLDELEKHLKEEVSAHFNVEKTELAIQQIREYQKTAPKFYDPLEEFVAIGRGKNLKDVEWQRLLVEMMRVSLASGNNYPFYIILHTFLVLIPDPTRRIDVLHSLIDIAPRSLQEKVVAQFIEDANSLIYVYMRLRILMLNNPLPKIWPYDHDLKEIVLWMNDISPEEYVAFSQVVLNRKQYPWKSIGKRALVLQIPKYRNIIQTDSGLEFCMGLYYAEEERQGLLSGNDDDYDYNRSIDAQPIDYRYKCYDLFINHCVKVRQKEYLKTHPLDQTKSIYYAEILKDLQTEYHYQFKKRHFKLDDPFEYEYHKARVEELVSYMKSLYEKEADQNGNVQPSKRKQKFCTYIVPNAGKSREEIEADLQEVSQKSAQRFVRLLLNFEKQGFLDFRGDSSSEVYEYLKERYKLKYSLGNFSRYFNK